MATMANDRVSPAMQLWVCTDILNTVHTHSQFILDCDSRKFGIFGAKIINSLGAA